MVTETGDCNKSETFAKGMIKGFPLGFQFYATNKWVPHVIPLECIPDLFAAFDKLPRKFCFNDHDCYADFIVYRNKLLFMFTYLLALRDKEAVCIKFVDLFQTPDGKYNLRVDGANNKRKRDRVMPIPDELEARLKEFFTKFQYKKYWNGSEWLFPSYRNKNQHLSTYQWRDTFQAAIRESGLWRPHPRKPGRGLYTLHSLRHSRAVHLLEASDFDLYSVSNYLGHGRVDVTMCYLHACPSLYNHMRDISNVNLPYLNLSLVSPLQH